MILRTPRRLAAVIAAAMIAPALGVASAQAVGPAVDRIAGEGRFDTGAATTQDAFSPEDVDVVYVATGRGFPDALSAGAAAAETNGAVVLTEKDSLPQVSADEIERLDPSRIVVVGGTTVVSDAVFDALEDLTDAEVVRLAGENRYETAAKVALDAFPDGADFVVLSTGRNYPDALAGGPAADVRDAPIILTEPDSLPDETADALRALAPRTVLVIGGTAAVSDDVVDAAGAFASSEDVPTSRAFGPDRVSTSIQLSFNFSNAGTVYLATGRNFPDALAGGPAAAFKDAPILLVEPDASSPTLERVTDRICDLRPARIVILGGESAVPKAVADRVATNTADCGEPFEAEDAIGFSPFLVGQVREGLVAWTEEKGNWLITTPNQDDGNIVYSDIELSPDGTSVAWTQYDRGEGTNLVSEVYVVDLLDGDGEPVLVTAGVDDQDPNTCTSIFEVRWRPGTEDTLAYACSGDAYTVVVGSEPVPVGQAEEFETVQRVVWNPDGTRLLTASDFSDVRLRAVDFGPDAVTGSTVLLTEDNSENLSLGFDHLHWGPDSSYVAGVSTDPDREDGFQERVFRVDVGTDAAVVLFDADPARNVNGVTILGIGTDDQIIVVEKSDVDILQDDPDLDDSQSQRLLSVSKGGDMQVLLGEEQLDDAALVSTSGDVHGTTIVAQLSGDVDSRFDGAITMQTDGSGYQQLATRFSYTLLDAASSIG